jgi:hypothetical protein
MAKKSKPSANKKKPVGRQLVEGEMKQSPDDEQVLHQKNVDNLGPTQGFLNPDNKPPPLTGELKDADYKEGDDEEKESENDDGDDSPQEEEQESSVQYFYDNEDEETGKRVGCTFVNMSVRAGGDTGCALVGPADSTGGCLVCGWGPCDDTTSGADITRHTARIVWLSRPPRAPAVVALTRGSRLKPPRALSGEVQFAGNAYWLGSLR